MACLTSLGKGIVLSRPPLTVTRAVQRPWLQTIEDTRRFLTSLTRRLVRARVNCSSGGYLLKGTFRGSSWLSATRSEPDGQAPGQAWHVWRRRTLRSIPWTSVFLRKSKSSRILAVKFFYRNCHFESREVDFG